MIWAGEPFARLIEFGTGAPVGAISYQLLANDGSELLSNSVVPDANAVSHLLVIEGTNNTVALPLFENRTLVWSYTTATGLVTGRTTYRVNRAIPFAATGDNVRARLGVSAHELPDDVIDIVAGYADLLALVSTLDDYAATGDRNTLLATSAITAMAALAVIPTLQMRAAQAESSGDDRFTRFNKIDWEWLIADLTASIDRFRAVVDPTFDTAAIERFLFSTVAPTPDAITGEA